MIQPLRPVKILIANIGSTSLKWRLFGFTDDREHLLHKGGLERVSDYTLAIDTCIASLKEAGAIGDEKDLAAIGFKTVVAKDMSGCVRVDETVLAAMAAYNDLAPAHNPPYIAGIRRFAERMAGIPLIALFETAFHQYAPEAARRYAVPESWYEAGVRRLGFHGASHKFVAERSAELLGRGDVAERARKLYTNAGACPITGAPLRVISCHLGGSSSITGILNGVSIGTSMGMSPQSGMPQNNRVGDLDVEALPHAMKALGISMEEARRQLSSEAGLLGLSMLSNDIRDISEAAEVGKMRSKLALDVFVHSARHWMGAYFLEMNGADAIVFTAGIGENRPELRAAICANLENLGIRLDGEKNHRTLACEGAIHADNSAVQVLVIPANEECVVARETKRFLDSHPD